MKSGRMFALVINLAAQVVLCASALAAPPPNDACGNATVIGNVTNLPYDTTEATSDGPSGCDVGACLGKDIWYNYQATCFGTLTVSTCGTGFDNIVAVYQGWGCGPGELIACALSNNLPGCNPFSAAAVQIQVTQGQQIKIRIAGRMWFCQDPASGTGFLTVSCVPDVCGDAGAGSCCQAGGNGSPYCNNSTCCQQVCTIQPSCCDTMWNADCAALANSICTTCVCPGLPPQETCFCAGSISDGTTGFEHQGSNAEPPFATPCGNFAFDRWWNYTASCTGTLTVETVDSNFGNMIALYDGWECPVATLLGCDAGMGGTSDDSRVQIAVAQGQQIKIRFGSGGDTGDARLRITCSLPVCGDPGLGECCGFGGHGGPLCNNVPCCSAVSAMLPHCETQWDGVCAALAAVECNVCGQAEDCNANGIPDAWEMETAAYLGQWATPTADPNQNFGSAVATRGSKMIVAAVGENSDRGALYFYRDLANDLGAWQQVHRLANLGSQGDRVGISVDVQGNQGIAGADRDDQGGADAGAAYKLFDATSVGGNWQLSFKIVPDDAAPGDHFGAAVAVFGDRCIIGAPDAAAGGSGRGKAYVYRTNIPSLIATLTPTGAANNDSFGWSVAMRSNGYAVIGAPLANGTVLADVGAAYVFSSSGGWHEEIKLLAGDQQPFVGFGAAVDIDGSTIVVGAPGDSSNGTGSGSAYVFKETSVGTGDWIQVAKLTGSDPRSFAQFGRSVAVSGDTVVVGAPGYLASLGAIFVFRESPADGSWVEVGRTLVQSAGAAGDEFGNAVAANGDVIAVGAWRYNEKGNPDTGLLSVFRKPAFDCNGNFIPDDCEPDQNGNGVPDECESPPCAPPDINCDGFVDETDRDLFVAVLIGTNTDPDHVARSDLNGDSEVNGLDIGLFVSLSTKGG